MGELLQTYLAASLPALQAIVDEEEPPKPAIPPGVEGIQQAEGATTFPMGAEAGPMQGQPIDVGGQPTAPMGVMPPPGAGAAPSFGGEPPPGGPQPAIPAAAGAEPEQDRSAEFEKGPDSFMGMADEQSPEDIDNAVKVMESNGVDIDAQHAELTGTEAYESEDDPKGEKAGKGDEKKMTRQEKGLILMEFGLSLMASSGSGTGTIGGDIGKAGGAALAGHMGRETQRKEMLLEAEDRKLDRELKRAQITKAGREPSTVKTDKDGNYIRIIGGEATPILTPGGERVTADNAERFNTDVDRQAYEELECEGLSGKELKSCKRRALAYAKGGGARVAFPELERADQTDKVMKNLEDPDKRSAKYHVPSTGQTMRWRDMSPAQQDEVATGFVDRRMRIWEGGGKDKAPTAGRGIEGLSAEDVARMKPGKIYTLSDDRKAKLVNGVPTIID
jgi:hypothetical protein